MTLKLQSHETTLTHTVIGGGVIGLMTALSLAKKGVKVTVLDRVVPGDPAQASYGNAGMLAFASYRPIAEPGLWWQGIKMLFQPSSALSVPRHYRAKITPWLIRLLRESSKQRSDQNAYATATLNAYSLQCWQNLIEEHALQDDVKPTGWLKVFETDQAFEVTRKQLPVLEDFGFTYDQLTAQQVYDLEPALAAEIRHGIMQKQSLAIQQPNILLQKLAVQLQNLGGVIEKANVLSIQKTHSGFKVRTDSQKYSCSKLSVCAGAWSQRLLVTLGCHYPLETERGYHMMLQGNYALKQPLMHVEKQIVLSPMNEGLRVTTGEELAGLDAEPDYRIIERKLKDVRLLLPTAELEVSDRWLGFRPSLPDSKPIIAQHPTIAGLTLAFGHGHLGMTQSAATGYLLSQIILGEKTDIDCTELRADRFSSLLN